MALSMLIEDMWQVPENGACIQGRVLDGKLRIGSGISIPTVYGPLMRTVVKIVNHRKEIIQADSLTGTVQITIRPVEPRQIETIKRGHLIELINGE